MNWNNHFPCGSSRDRKDIITNPHVDARTRWVDDHPSNFLVHRNRDLWQNLNYDLALWAQHTAPTGNPSFFLNQFFRSDGASNLNGYNSPTTDEMLDRLAALPAGTERDSLAVEIQHQLRADEAVLFLVDPQWHIAVTDRLANYQPYCGDYFVVDAKLGLS